MSCVRRMCRILVDCDDNTPSQKAFMQAKNMDNSDSDSDDDDSSSSRRRRRRRRQAKEVREEPPPPTPGSGTTAVAQCWRDIVFAGVSQVRGVECVCACTHVFH